MPAIDDKRPRTRFGIQIELKGQWRTCEASIGGIVAMVKKVVRIARGVIGANDLTRERPMRWDRQPIRDVVVF